MKLELEVTQIPNILENKNQTTRFAETQQVDELLRKKVFSKFLS